MTTNNFVACEGAHVEPTGIVREPQTHVDNWGNLCGYYGKGTCSICSREIGLDRFGKVSRHGRPKEQGS